MPNDNQNIPWRRLSAEGAAIVLSILIAFAIDAYWDEFQENRRLEEILTALEAGLVEGINLIDGNVEVVRNDHERLKRFVDISTDQLSQIPEEERFHTLRAMWKPNTSPLNIDFLQNLLGEGVLGSLRNLELQQEIASWQSWVGQLDERVQKQAEFETAIRRSLGRNPDIWPYLGQSEPQGRPTLSVDLLRKVREDEEIMSIVVGRMYSASVHQFYLQNMRRQEEKVLELLRAELAK